MELRRSLASIDYGKAHCFKMINGFILQNFVHFDCYVFLAFFITQHWVRYQARVFINIKAKLI